jgi:hypothetical protein
MTVPTQPATSLAHKYREIRNKIELTDLLFVLYALVFARQYFWIHSEQFHSMGVQRGGDARHWLFLHYKQTVSDGQIRLEFLAGRCFAFANGLPARAAFPDRSFDVLNYHLLHSDRSLTGPLLGAGDYFPTAVPFNQSVTRLPVSLVTHSVSGWALQSSACADIGGANYRQAPEASHRSYTPSISLRSPDFAFRESLV